MKRLRDNDVALHENQGNCLTLSVVLEAELLTIVDLVDYVLDSEIMLEFKILVGVVLSSIE